MNNVTKSFSFEGKTRQLNDVCLDIVDCHHSTPKWTESGRLVIRNFNIKNGRLNLHDCSFTDDATFIERTQRARPEPGDLIITREAPMGEVCIIPEGVECCLGQRMVLLKPDPDKVDAKYLLYALQSEFVQKQIQQSDKTGSIVSNLRIPVLKELKIPSFDVAVEQRIGYLLDCLVSKIELNNRINAELEAMAKLIYDYWFVQFDFPISKEQAQAMGNPKLEGKPYKASGGKMVWNEELKREVPEGWGIFSLQELGDFKNGVNYDPSNPGNIPCRIINVRNISAASFFIANNDLDTIYLKESDVRKYSVHQGSIIIARSGIPGATRLIADVPKNTLYCGFAIRFEMNDITLKNLCFFFLKSLELNISNGAGGTILKNVSQATLNNLSISIPDKPSIVDRFNGSITPLFDKINLIQKENQKLSQLRDWLLPMLMNGQVRIKNVEEKLAMAAEEEIGYR